MARLSPRMGILFRFFTVAYGGQRTFRNERRVDERYPFNLSTID